MTILPTSSATKQCTVYKFAYGGSEFSIIDTPGLRDAAVENFEVLKQIANEVAKRTRGKKEPWIDGAIYFHRITGKRFTHSDRVCLSIFEAICGEGFYPCVACLTTMWDDIRDGEEKYFDNLSKELREDYMNFSGCGPGVFDLKGNGDIELLLETFSRIRNRNRDHDRGKELQLEKEIKKLSANRYKKTTAGLKVAELVQQELGACGVCVIL